MRNDQPITQREYVLRPDMVIISHTDLRGNISFVNDDFLEASGFGEEEVMGRPHNILRHPDMPARPFATCGRPSRRAGPGAASSRTVARTAIITGCAPR